MSNTYHRSSTFLKYLNVLRQNGTAPTFPGEYTAPTYTILFKNGSFSTVIAETVMTQGLDNVWYFSYTIPSNENLGTYLVKYRVVINGTTFETTEDYIIALETESSGPVGPGVGQYAITDEVQSDSMVDLSGVDVYVFLPSNTASAIAHASTDTNGTFTVYLDSGTYIILFSKAGYINETHTLTVDVGGTFNFSGN